MRSLLMIVCCLLAGPAFAQISGYGKSTAPIVGGINVSPQPGDRFQSLAGTYAAPHKTPDGKPCISVYPSNRAQIGKPDIFDQIVLVRNVCGQTVKVRVCFAGSTDCIELSVGGYQKVQRILGISAGSKAFRYDYRELY